MIRNPSVEDWIRHHGNLTRRGSQWEGPCPVCGGTDRFWVRARRDGNGAFANCRHCLPKGAKDTDGSKTLEWKRAVGFDIPDRPAGTRTAPTRQTAPISADDAEEKAATVCSEDHDNNRTVAAIPLIAAAAVAVPARVRFRWAKGVIACAPPTPKLRWISVGDLRRVHAQVERDVPKEEGKPGLPWIPPWVAGALVAPLGDGSGYHLVTHDADLGKGGPDKLLYGPTKARGFAVRSPGDDLRIVEGLKDAFAIGAAFAGTTAAPIGSTKIVGLAMHALIAEPRRWRRIILQPDGSSKPGDQTAVRHCMEAADDFRLLKARHGSDTTILCEPLADDPFDWWAENRGPKPWLSTPEAQAYLQRLG